ncbi:hypothetical protein NNJEOMEG_03039 [Fundidesulfovibrio magnetotacticus]|uniref:Histidine kinase/HSP90-like ATPase domain-containing protein n=1 Tax=Fundidesulfovibrio magnetotacticus TaxID=2730080 RepID=A0A6V8LX69_9BACT|nr:ATP-binding protein [Fundidesulfovibrio magnetotacticus]GFK95181.1 hypothetical protein NNJEOMEG_03039 [Fundidesulfovibrio magnetotacticus]
MNNDRPDPGPGPSEHPAALRMSVPASLAAIDLAVEEVRRRLQASAPEADLFPALTALREALLNAVVHGCRQDPALAVDLELNVDGNEAIILVTDPGPGFDWRERPPTMPPAGSTSGRGRCIMNLYALAVRYNEAGNGLTLRLALA